MEAYNDQSSLGDFILHFYFAMLNCESTSVLDLFTGTGMPAENCSAVH